MGVDAEREARICVSEVLRDGLHRLSGVDENRCIEVAQSVHAVLAPGLDSGSPQRRVPDVRVEVVAIERLVLAADEDELVGLGREASKVL